MDYERRVRDLACRLAGYALLGQSVLKHLERLLDTYDARRYVASMPPRTQKRLASAVRQLQAVVGAVGDDGVYPWL